MKRIIGLFVLIVLLNLSRSASALLVLDQEHTAPGFTGAFAVASDRTEIQTFTVGITGLLEQVDVAIYHNSDAFEPITMSLWSTDINGLPVGFLRSASLPASSVNGFPPGVFTPFSFSSNPLSVKSGDLLAIELNSNASNDAPFTQRYLWNHAEQYADGKAYTFTAGQLTLQDDDFHFRTFVSTGAAVPEPATFLLFSLGGLFFRRRI